MNSDTDEDNALPLPPPPSPPPPGRPTATVKEIMSKVVSKQSADKYSGQNSIFAMYLYDSAELRDLLLEPSFVRGLDALATNSQKKKYAKQCCLDMSPGDDNCPLILLNLTFIHFSTFVTLRKARKGKHRGKAMSLGNASYEQAQSALKHLFRMSKYSMDPDFFTELKQFTKGIRRHVADKKVLEGDVSIIGKKKMGFDVYKKICELFLKEEGEEFIFARAFLCLEWNLMARSENVVNAHIFHIEWNADCLVFRFVKSKGDQTGRNSDQEWHVYANPHNPEICPVLALACYIFSNPGIFQEGEEEVVKGGGSGSGSGSQRRQKGRLFPGGNQYDRFMDCLHRIVVKYPEAFFALGISPGDLGSHSARKGASSHACSGTTVSPPMVSICLRAMWSMGHVKERYLQYEKAGDQYLGRVVSGLDVNSVKFAVSPPYFEFDETTDKADGGIEAPDDGTWKKIHTLLRDYMVRGEFVSASVHRIFYFCFASLCFHADFLKRVLHDRNKLRASHFFTHIPINIQAAATVKYPWTLTAATPTLTGLPPHITILANFERMIAEMETTKNSILAGVEAELDRRRIGSQSHFDKQEILDAMLTMHTEVLKKVDLCVRSSTTALQQIEIAPFDGPTGDVPSFFVNDAADESVGGQPLNIVENVSRRKFQYFYSAGGSIRRLPQNFVFPHMGLCALIVNWFCGNPRENTMPLKFIVAADLKGRKMKCEYRKMKVMMGAVIAGAKELGVWDEGYHGAWDVPRAMRLYNEVKDMFDYPSLTSTHRSVQISWRTVYNLYIDSRGGHGGRQGCGRGRGRGRGRRDEIVAVNDESDDWMNEIEAE